MPLVISTLTDTINVPAVTWRDGSLTQRLADLFRNSGAGGAGGSSVFTTGIVRGFEVYPTASNNTVELLVNQTSGDSLVTITAPDGSSTIQYRSFDALEVDMAGAAAGVRFLAFKPNFTSSALQIVVYSEAEFIAGDLATDSAVLIASIQSGSIIEQKNIGYVGTFFSGGALRTFARGRVYNEELIEQVVVDFGDAESAANVEITGAGAADTTAAVVASGSTHLLRLTNSGASEAIVSIPFYLFIDPDSRVGAFLNTANKVRAIIEATAATGSPALWFVLSTAATTDDSDFPLGVVAINTANISSTNGFFPIEIVPASSSQKWCIAQVVLQGGEVIDIKSITLEVDRFRQWAIGGTKAQNIVPRAVQYSSSATDYVRIGIDGVVMDNGTKTTTIAAEEWVLATPDSTPADAYEITFTPEQIDMVNDIQSITIDVNSASIAMETTGVGNSIIGWSSATFNDPSGAFTQITKDDVSLFDATSDTSLVLVPESLTHSAATFDIGGSTLTSKIGIVGGSVYGSQWTSDDASDHYLRCYYVNSSFGWELAVSAQDLSGESTISKSQVRVSLGLDSSIVESDGVTTTGLFTGLNTPKGIGVAIFDGTNWGFSATASKGVFTGVGVPTNDPKQVTLACTSTTNLGMIASVSGASANYVLNVYGQPALIIGANVGQIVVDLHTNAAAGDFVTVLLFGE